MHRSESHSSEQMECRDDSSRTGGFNEIDRISLLKQYKVTGPFLIVHAAGCGEFFAHQSVEIGTFPGPGKDFSYAPENEGRFSDKGKVYPDPNGLNGPPLRIYKLTSAEEEKVMHYVREKSEDKNLRYIFTSVNCLSFVDSVEQVAKKVGAKLVYDRNRR